MEELHRLNKETLEVLGEPYEIIVVDNGSTDGTLAILKRLSPIKIIALTRNFGQTAGLEVGINAAKGDKIVIMDGDLQNDPRDIPKMLTKLDEGYDVVAGWRKDRHDSWFRRFHSYWANWLTRKVSGLNIHDHACALKVYKRKFIENLNLYGIQHVFLAAQAYNLGARIAEVEVIHHARTSGLSKHHLMAGVKAIADLFVVRFLAPSTRPLVFLGLRWLVLCFLTAVLGTLAVVFSKVVLVVIAIAMFFLALFSLMFGFIIEFLRRIYFGSSHESRYIIREVVEQ